MRNLTAVVTVICVCYHFFSHSYLLSVFAITFSVTVIWSLCLLSLFQSLLSDLCVCYHLSSVLFFHKDDNTYCIMYCFIILLNTSDQGNKRGPTCNAHCNLVYIVKKQFNMVKLKIEFSINNNSWKFWKKPNNYIFN